MNTAIFPGSFDPPTYGHLDLIERSSGIFERLTVLVSVNPHKQAMFSAEERLRLVSTLCVKYTNVTVVCHEGLVVEYARNNKINVIIRGLRPLSDFAYEFELAMLNKQINSDVETFFLATASQFSVLRSSALKEMALFGADISAMAPPVVKEAVLRYIKETTRARPER